MALEKQKKENVLNSKASVQGLFKARDETSLFYEVRGKGRPLIFCYGLVCRREHWTHQLEYFSTRYQVVTFDYRGHHRSSFPKNDRNLSIQWCANDLLDLISYLGFSEVLCLGHSLGVPVVALAALEQKKIIGQVLICGPVTNPFDHMFYTNRMNHLFRFSSQAHQFLPEFVDWVWKFFTQKNKLNYILTSQLGFNPDAALEKDVLSYMEGVNRTSFSVFLSLLRDYSGFDARPVLCQLKIPSLVIAGEEDLVTPLHVMKEIASLLPNGTLKVIPDASHNAHSDFPKEVNELIDGFFLQTGF